MAQPLSKSLRPASFRGVPFQVESTDMGVGRRTQLHEYPQRDIPYNEDLGRAARDLSFEGFVVGADYVAQANRLLDALEQPGPGTLVHPWFGTLTVSQQDKARVSFNQQLGLARFSFSFIESGELSFPQAAAATSAQSRLAAESIQTAAVSDFAKGFSVAGVQDFVTTQAKADLATLFATLGGGKVPGLALLGYADRAASYLQSAISLLASPSSLGWGIVGFLGLAPYVGTAYRWQALAAALVRLSKHNAFTPPYVPANYTPSRQQAYTNTKAVNALARQVILAQAVGATSFASAAVHDDTVALRNVVTAALDAEALNASDNAYTALTDARGVVWQDLTTRARDSARLSTKTPPETTPALVLAYDWYEDASRATEIVTRNQIRHPGFVPPLPLKVLTR